MTKSILVTGATDGIGELTAKMLAADGHRLLLHGRNPAKLEAVAEKIGGKAESYIADLSDLNAVDSFAGDVLSKHDHLDVLINNAGVLTIPQSLTKEGLDIRFVVNTLAPYRLTQKLLPIIPSDGRIINVSSAAQAALDPKALLGGVRFSDMEAYAQSKLALTIWSRELAHERPGGPMVLTINPGSLLASKMVQEGFGIAGNDLTIGADILCRAALDEMFNDKSGQYFDNDAGRFAEPHKAALNDVHVAQVMQFIQNALKQLIGTRS